MCVVNVCLCAGMCVNYVSVQVIGCGIRRESMQDG